MKSPPNKLHPLIKELKIAGGSAPKDAPNATEILDYLLREKIISDETLRTAHSTLLAEKSNAADVQQKEKASTNVALSSHTMIRTRHVALEVFYDGEKYSGLAENVGQDNDQSIERALFTALQKCQFITSRETAQYSRCGRTDKGVSAAGQVVALHLKSAFSPATSWDADGRELVQDHQLPKNSLEAKTVYVPPRKPKAGATRQRKELTEFAYDNVLNNLLPPEIRGKSSFNNKRM